MTDYMRVYEKLVCDEVHPELASQLIKHSKQYDGIRDLLNAYMLEEDVVEQRFIKNDLLELLRVVERIDCKDYEDVVCPRQGILILTLIALMIPIAAVVAALL